MNSTNGIGCLKVGNLGYADGTTLFTTSVNHMEELLQRIEKVSLEFGLKINRIKTKVMIVDRTNNDSPEINQFSNCEVIQAYISLRSLITINGGCANDVKL